MDHPRRGAVSTPLRVHPLRPRTAYGRAPSRREIRGSACPVRCATCPCSSPPSSPSRACRPWPSPAPPPHPTTATGRPPTNAPAVTGVRIERRVEPQALRRLHPRPRRHPRGPGPGSRRGRRPHRRAGAVVTVPAPNGELIDFRVQRGRRDGGRPRRPPPGADHLRRSRRRRPDRHHPPRPHADGLPRLRPRRRQPGRLVRRPGLERRRQPLPLLPRTATCRAATAAWSSPSSTRTPSSGSAPAWPRRPAPRSACGPTASRWSPTRRTPTYFGTENVLAEKVTLMNRVNQIYNDDLAVRMVLIDDTDKLNLDTAAKATEPNGPCGSAAVLHAGPADRLRRRLAQPQPHRARPARRRLNYDVGHLALGVNGGGVAGLGVIGGDGKARGCTGLPDARGRLLRRRLRRARDRPPVRRPAHLQRHRVQLLGGNRGGSPVEPGSGSSIMAYAGICQQDNLQPHSDPYFSQRSITEISNTVDRHPRADQRDADGLAAWLRHRRRVVHPELQRHADRADRARHQLHHRRHRRRHRGRAPASASVDGRATSAARAATVDRRHRLRGALHRCAVRRHRRRRARLHAGLGRRHRLRRRDRPGRPAAQRRLHASRPPATTPPS